MAKDKDFFSTRQVAQRYGVSQRHLRDMVKRRKFPQPVRIGAAWRWALATLLQWEKAGGSK